MLESLPDRPEVYNATSWLAGTQKWRRSGYTVGFVPTMGALHRGHLSLIREAARENELVVVSIYVNPAQFGAHEDLDSYPKTFESDMAQLTELNQTLQSGPTAKGAPSPFKGKIAAVLVPTTQEIYPFGFPSQEVGGNGSFVTITPLGSILEGASRPVFFRGVATVCLKLFNIVRPDSVYFGQKDIQQTRVIKRMVLDFHLGLRVRVVSTEREPDGLALCSRNVYLGERRRQVAVVLSQALFAAVRAYDQPNQTPEDLIAAATTVLEEARKAQECLPDSRGAKFDIDYVSLGEMNDLQPIKQAWPDNGGAILSAAIVMRGLTECVEGERLGINQDASPVRLIDNVLLGKARDELVDYPVKG